MVRKELVSDLVLECVFGQSGTLREIAGSQSRRRLFRWGLHDLWGCGSFRIIGGDVVDPEKVLEVIRAELPQILSSGISEADIDRQRKAATGQLLKSFNSLENIAGSYCSSRFMGADPFEVVDLLNKIQPLEVADRLHDHVRPENLVSSIISPAQG